MTLREMLAPTVQRIATALPSLLIGLGILLAGYVIAKIAAGIVSRILGRTRLDARTAEALGLTGPGAPTVMPPGFLRPYSRNSAIFCAGFSAGTASVDTISNISETGAKPFTGSYRPGWVAGT